MLEKAAELTVHPTIRIDNTSQVWLPDTGRGVGERAVNEPIVLSVAGSVPVDGGAKICMINGGSLHTNDAY